MIEAVADGAADNYIGPIRHRLIQVIDKQLINTGDSIVEECTFVFIGITNKYFYLFCGPVNF